MFFETQCRTGRITSGIGTSFLYVGANVTEDLDCLTDMRSQDTSSNGLQCGEQIRRFLKQNKSYDRLGLSVDQQRPWCDQWPATVVTAGQKSQR